MQNESLKFCTTSLFLISFQFKLITYFGNSKIQMATDKLRNTLTVFFQLFWWIAYLSVLLIFWYFCQGSLMQWDMELRTNSKVNCMESNALSLYLHRSFFLFHLCVFLSHTLMLKIYPWLCTQGSPLGKLVRGPYMVHGNEFGSDKCETSTNPDIEFLFFFFFF